MIADLFEVRQTHGRGKGLFARTPIPKGTLIDYECNRCSRVCARSDLERLPHAKQQEILEHTYATDENHVILDCSIGRYMNHSCEPNVLETDEGFDIAIRAIEGGEEVTCDYRQFNDPDSGFRCHCGAPTCCGHVRCLRPVPPDLRAEWRRQTVEACHEVKLPFQFSTGIGPSRRSVPTWHRGPDGIWCPQEIGLPRRIAQAIAEWLTLQEEVEIVVPANESPALVEARTD